LRRRSDKFTGGLTKAGRKADQRRRSRNRLGLDKAQIGEKLRSTFETAATEISEVNHRAYKGMPEVIEPTRPVPEATEPLRTVMSDILSKRMESGVSKLTPELKPIAALMRRQGGASFDGLQRARARLGKAIDFDKRQGGMEQGDLKQAYGALTDAMERAVRGAAKVEPDAAVAAWKAADANFAESTGNVKSIAQALKAPSDEALVNQVIGLAGEKAGNAKRLIQLQSDIGAQSMQMLGSSCPRPSHGGRGNDERCPVLDRDGQALEHGQSLSCSGQSRSNVEDAACGRRRAWAEQEAKFANRSNTGRAALTGGMIGLLCGSPASVHRACRGGRCRGRDPRAGSYAACDGPRRRAGRQVPLSATPSTRRSAAGTRSTRSSANCTAAVIREFARPSGHRAVDRRSAPHRPPGDHGENDEGHEVAGVEVRSSRRTRRHTAGWRRTPRRAPCRPADILGARERTLMRRYSCGASVISGPDIASLLHSHVPMRHTSGI
jgi:hypothetical protein